METEFLILRRELQQHVPIPQIYAHIDSILSRISPESFQSSFLFHVAPHPIGPGLLKKLAAFLMARFDRIYDGKKYALQDEFVEFLASVNVAADGKCDRYYELNNFSTVHIRTSESLISEGTTGFSLWESSVALLALLSRDPSRFDDCFRDKRVLELGSGTGLGGLAIAALSSPDRVLLTDIAQVHDSYTRPNLLLNPQIPHIDSTVLHWNDYDRPLDFDTIVGCDLVYDPEVCSLLHSVLRTVLTHQGSSVKTVLLVCTLRNPSTFDYFVRDMEGIPDVLVDVSLIENLSDAHEIVLKSIEAFRIIKITRI